MKKCTGLVIIILLLIVTTGYTAVAGSFQSKKNQHIRLTEQLEIYKSIAESKEWISIPAGTCLQYGDSSSLVTALRTNLLLTGDLKEKSASELVFDEYLKEGVRNFQLRHGLLADGIVGQQTMEALLISPTRRMQQIKLNIARWETYYASNKEAAGILVNIPDYTLHLLDAEYNTVWQTRVIVGLPTKGYQTVPLQDEITYLVFNPTWNVPKSIIKREIIPIMQKDPGYLARNHMQVFRISGAAKTRISAGSINWHRADPENDKFQIIQLPGSWNALGKVKFMFPNKYSIYLHDTPAKLLFNHQKRAYSHGCVRVQNPDKLAAYLLSPDWTNLLDIGKHTNSGIPEKIVRLEKPVPICLGYFTSWVNDDGQLQFRKDIYKRDITITEKVSVF